MVDGPLPGGLLDSFLENQLALFIERLFAPENLDRVQKIIENGVARGETIAAGAQVDGALDAVAGAAAFLERADNLMQAIAAPFFALLAGHLLGVHVSADDLRTSATMGEGSPIAHAVVGRVFSAIRGPEGGLTPSDEGAQRFLGMLGSLTFQSWFEGIVFEHVISQWPGQEALEATSSIAKDLINNLGLNRLARTALRPLVAATITTPLQWKVNKTYRPTLLGPSTAISQFMRGRWDWADVVEELARAGYDDTRIDALLNEHRKFFGTSDVRTFVDRTYWTADQGLQHLRDQGYDEAGALDALRLEGIHRIDQVESQEAGTIIGAYVARDIDRGEFTAQLEAHVKVATERALFTEIGELRRALNIKRLSSGEVAAAVHAQILAFVDYRRALEREGYPADDVLVKELLLRWELDKERSIEQHRADADAERAAEKAARDVAAAAKRTQLEADRVARRRGPASALERAVVRGLIPIARYEEVLTADYDADTVAILVDLVEGDRQTYLDQQQRAADAAKRATVKGLDIGQLQAAVLTNVLTLQQFSAELRRSGFNDADVGVLTATLQARYADLVDAKAKRAEAAIAASRRSIDLGRFEQLVRRGSRTVPQYDQLLAELGFDEPSRAAMTELLQLHIDDDAAARQAREEADARTAAGALTIAEFRRAVVLGVKTFAEFELFLVDAHVTADVHALLVAELQDDVDQAEAARRRRQAAESRTDARELPLATVARAARLGIVTPATYQARLARANYTADDIAIEMDLLLTEIADVQAARQQRDAIERTLVAKGLSLADTARAVKAGFTTLEGYQARAIALGVSPDDVKTLTRVLADELRETQAAKVRRTEIASALEARQVSLVVLEDQVHAGTLTLDAYIGTLADLGYALEDAELLATLLRDDLERAQVGA